MTPARQRLIELMEPRRNKYGAKKTRIGEQTFASAGEAKRYVYLKRLEDFGEITQLQIQPVYKLVVNGRLVGRYTPDFSYLPATGGLVVEDFKGRMTADASLRMRLFTACYPTVRLMLVDRSGNVKPFGLTKKELAA